MRMRRLVLWAAVASVAIALGLHTSGLLPSRLPELARMPLAASVGGPFELTAHDGKRFSSASLAGKPFALFFGFTQCPDICPTTLLEMSNHLTRLGDKARDLHVIFVTVDPERDTPQHLAAYLKNFDPRIVGLTGTAAEIATAVKAYRAVYEKVATSGGYTMNHTALVYLMDAHGQLASTLTFQEPEATQRQKLQRLVEPK